MAKPLKNPTPRTPDTAGPDHSVIDACLQRVMPDLEPALRMIDAIIREEHPDVQFAVKWRRPYYWLEDRGWIIELAPYEVSFNIVFYGGADFDAPPPLGDCGRSRYVKLRSLAEADSDEVRDWIRQAGQVEGWHKEP